MSLAGATGMSISDLRGRAARPTGPAPGRGRPALSWVRVTLAALACLTPAACQAPPPPPPPRPNIVFILVDTLRADRLGCYGDPRRLAPLIDSLAAEGMLFERPIAPAPWTLPSVGSYMTGVYPSVHQVNHSRYDPHAEPTAEKVIRQLPEELITLAEALQAQGYQAAAFSANPFIRAKNGFGQGFEHFDDEFTSNTTPGSKINQQALAWLEQRTDPRPLFLYLHYMDVHAPYYADDKYLDPLLDQVEALPARTALDMDVLGSPPWPKGYQSLPRHQELRTCVEYWAALYDGGIQQMNEYLEQLRAALRERGLWDDALIILAGDHGESLCEHQIWGHGDSVYQCELFVPWIMRWPPQLPAGRRVPGTVSLMDLFPTLLDLLQIPVPAENQAHSRAAALRGAAPVATMVFAEGVKQRPHIQVLVSGPWKLFGDVELDQWELYNLDADPTERANLAAAEPARVASLRATIDEIAGVNRALAQDIRVRSAPITPEELRRLQGLGYLGGVPPENEDAEDSAAPEGE